MKAVRYLLLGLVAGVIPSCHSGRTFFTSSGLLAPAFHRLVGNQPESVAVGDFNRDGSPDVVVANFGSDTVSVLLGTGDGGFLSAVSYATGAGPGTGPGAVAVADMNRDGIPDLVVANRTTNEIAVLLGTVTGTFGAATTFAAGASAPRHLIVADFNEDGKPDVAVACQSEGLSILLGAGDGTLGAADVTLTGASTGPYWVAAGDFNRDGHLDLAVVYSAADAVAVFLGVGDGTFVAPSLYSVQTLPQSVAVGDFNRDGVPDLAVSNDMPSGTISILVGAVVGDGTFGSASNIPAGARPFSVTVTDIDRDGMQDLVVANFGTSQISVILGTGPATFDPPRAFFVDPGAQAVAVDDVNRGGFPDVIVAERDSQTIGILLHN